MIGVSHQLDQTKSAPAKDTNLLEAGMEHTFRRVPYDRSGLESAQLSEMSGLGLFP